MGQIQKVNRSYKPRIAPHIKSNPKKYIKKKNKYNEHFTERELKAAIKQKNTTSGEDTIYPQMIQKLPPETLKYLLDLYNIL